MVQTPLAHQQMTPRLVRKETITDWSIQKLSMSIIWYAALFTTVYKFLQLDVTMGTRLINGAPG